MRKVSGCRHCYTCICASAIGENSSVLPYRHGADPNYRVSTSKTGKHGQAECQFVGTDIFNRKKLEDFVRSSPNCYVVEVSKTGKHGQAECQFVGTDIFNRKKLEDFVRSSPNCYVVEVSTFKTCKHGQAKCHFVGTEIFNRKKLEDFVRSSHNCDVPQVNGAEFQLIDISMDGFVCLLTEMKEAPGMIWDPN